MTIKMIVDECDNYELQDITDTFSFNFSTADSGVSSRSVSSGGGGGGGSLRRSGLSQTNSMSFFLPLSAYTLKILGWEGGHLIPAGCTFAQYTFYPLQNSNSTLQKFSRLYKKPTTCKQCPMHGEKKRKETVFR